MGDFVWLAAEPLGGLVLGQEVSLNEETDVQCGDRHALAFRQGDYVKVEMVRAVDAADYAEKRRALFGAPSSSSTPTVPPPAEKTAQEDSEVRTLWVDFDEHGERYKRWRDVVKESYTPSFEEKPLEGPSTTLHLIKHAERHGGDPRLWLQLWARQKHVEPTDRVHHELKVLTDALYYGGSHDQLNLPALVSMEVLCRRIQAIVDAYSHPSKPSWENARLFSGQGSPEDIVSPTFRSYAVRKNKDKLELLQARQKVRELRGGQNVEDGELADTLPKGPKARSKAKAGGKGADGQQALDEQRWRGVGLSSWPAPWQRFEGGGDGAAWPAGATEPDGEVALSVAIFLHAPAKSWEYLVSCSSDAQEFRGWWRIAMRRCRV